MSFATHAIVGFTVYALKTLAAILAVMALETLLPNDKRPAPRSRLRGLTFWAVFIPVSAVIATSFGALWDRLGVRPLLDPDLGPLTFVVALLAADFGLYWFHRAQHRFLWRFHAVHHSIEDLSATGSYHHVSEELFKVVLMVAPMSVLIDLDRGATPLIVTLFLALNTHYLHSTTRLHFGPLRYILQDNRFHRLHHSTDPQHFERNFGGVFTIWDQAFGTAHFPKPGEWPAVGLAGEREPVSTLDYLTRPLASLTRRRKTNTPLPQ